ncbi:MAG: hypothetical protein M3308_02675 [Actinomycetota bacterium]|nr:hypothetical protein [Actinomycetota bacterium]
MQAQVVLPDCCIRLEPGGHAQCDMLVRNLSLAADRFTLEVVGAAASWTTLDPPVLTLGPDATGRVVVHFHPPRAAHVRAGRIPFGVLTMSARDGAGSVVEHLLEVGRFTDTALELIPRSVRRASATFQLIVANQGNTTLRVSVRGRDTAEAVQVECAPARLTVFPGEFAHSRIRVRPTRRCWRGPPVARPFQVVVDPGEEAPMIAAGELLQHPILPPFVQIRPSRTA